MSSSSFDPSDALQQLEKAAQEQKLSAGAVENIRKWLREPRYRAYAPQVADHVRSGKWQALDDAFWTVIPFGTGGRRGRMYPIGSNAINDRTIGESAQGLANYVKRHGDRRGELGCAIAYDTRHNSRHFAELCSEIMVAAGFRVYFLDDYRSTPELSFLVRYKQCSCGIMVTASHNPPSDNAVKVYWSTGGQVLPPHDKAIIDEVMSVEEIKRGNFQEGVQQGQIVICTEEVDRAYLDSVFQQRLPGPRDLRIIYSPLHGVGASGICPILERDDFKEVEVFEPHRMPSGDFPNVPGHVANPENPAVFEAMVQQARSVRADLVMATDPDCDRLGCAAPVSLDPTGPWTTFTGNQLAALLADFVLEKRKQAGTLSAEHYLVKTLVTTEMVRRIADSYGVRCYGNLHVGFKYIGGVMDEVGPDRFVLGAEESHGYLVGQYARDKDGVVAAMLLAELAAQLKADGKSLQEKLEALYWQHGYHHEQLINLQMEGSEGMARMDALMQRFRQEPPATLAGMKVTAVRDYQNQVISIPGQSPRSLDAPRGNMVILDLEEQGNYIAVRPSGTEPKVKFYIFTFVAAEQLADLEEAKQQMRQRVADLDRDLRALA